MAITILLLGDGLKLALHCVLYSVQRLFTVEQVLSQPVRRIILLLALGLPAVLSLGAFKTNTRLPRKFLLYRRDKERINS